MSFKELTNKKAFHDYFVEETIEAGIILEGWELKAILAGNANLKENYVLFKEHENGNMEAFILGMHITPLISASTHKVCDPVRNKKLLMHKHQLNKFYGKMKTKGYTVVITKIYLNEKGKLKAEVGLAKGKKNYDKKDTQKQKDIARDSQREIKYS